MSAVTDNRCDVIAQSRCVMLCVFISLLVCLMTISACATSGMVTGQAPAADTATAPAADTATASLLPTVPLSAAVLGGSVAAFDTRFGDANFDGSISWYYQGPFGNMSTSLGTMAVGPLDPNSHDRVIEITNLTLSDFSSSYHDWTITQAEKICTEFLPPDAHYLKTITAYQGGLVYGSEVQYTSTLLANSLPASVFTNVNGRLSPPGRFYIFYEKQQFSGNSNRCAVGTDEQTVQNMFL